MPKIDQSGDRLTERNGYSDIIVLSLEQYVKLLTEEKYIHLFNKINIKWIMSLFFFFFFMSIKNK